MANYLGYQFIDAANVICFDENGEFDSEKTNEVCSEKLAATENAVIPGFYGAMPNGKVKTFSRGGSDVTGSIVARAIKADVYENWTDVSPFPSGHGNKRNCQNALYYPARPVLHREIRHPHLAARKRHDHGLPRDV